MPYHPLQDLLDTYQSLSDFVQAVWLVVPLVFIFGLVALLLHHRLRRKQAAEQVPLPSDELLADHVIGKRVARALLVAEIEQLPLLEGNEKKSLN